MSRLKYLRDGNRLVHVSACACIYIYIRIGYMCALPTSLATFNILPYGFAVQLYRGTREQDFTRFGFYCCAYLLPKSRLRERVVVTDGGYCETSRRRELPRLVTRNLDACGWGFDENAFREFYVKSSATEEGEVRGESWQVVSRLLSLGF